MKRFKSFLIGLSIMCAALFVLAGCANNNKPDSGEQDNHTYYTVEFDSQGGSSVESQRILEGNTIRTPSVPTRETYSFIGWFTDTAENATEWKFSTDRVNSDLTLYAKWQSNEVQTPTESLTYERKGDGYVVTGASGQEEKIIIPAEHEGLPVTEIGESAFAYSKHTSDITFVSIPDTVTVIGLNAFYSRSELVTVDIGGNSALTEIGRNAFSGNRALKTIYIPKGVTKIGDSAFNNCGSLDSISVSTENSVYSGEGNNLIEKATNTLIRGSNKSVIPSSVTTIAQAAFRRANGITTLTIPLSVTAIGNYFIADSTITTIRYAGTEEQWNSIEMNAKMWNYGNRDVVVEYSATTNGSHILVAYFSRTGENYGVGNIPDGGYAGVIEKGNTEIVAEMIAEETNATLFEIVPVTPYPSSYSEMLNVAREEANTNARPAIKDTVENFGNYDIVFIGYPIWNGTCPNIMLTFMETYDFSGKTVIPFSTHAGSGLGSSMSTIRNKLSGATVVNGLAVSGATAQNNRDAAKTQVQSFVNSLDIDFSRSADMVKYDFADFSNVELINANLDSMSNEQLEILYLQAKYCQAMTDADTDTMRELTAENKTFTHMSGRTQTRDEYFADVKNGSLRYFTIGIDSPVVTVSGNTATVAYTSVLDANAYGAKGVYRISGTHYYEKQNGKWIAVNNPNK